MTAPTALRFERETCSRCGGSGHYSSCQMYGTTCFKCHGHGEALTKRARVARAAMLAGRQIKVRDVKPGMVIRACGSTYNVQTIAQDETSTSASLRDGVMVPNPPSWRIEGVKHGFVADGDHTVELIPTKAEQIEQLRAAIEHQNSLTKAGTPRAQKKEAA